MGNERRVLIALGSKTCAKCRRELEKGAWVELAGDDGMLCMDCSEFGPLDFLPAGNYALTMRARKYSERWAAVLKWSRARKRYERQGLIVEPDALERAHAECAMDEDTREKKRAKAAVRRELTEKEYRKQFGAAVREMFPRCPKGTEHVVAEHACRVRSGRVGRTGWAKELDPRAIRLAVTAHVRHVHTNYDELLFNGADRTDALDRVWPDVRMILDKWQGHETSVSRRSPFSARGAE
ncbi:MAG: DUF2293 domain-containing protein [Deltaproteobacteria bacterium]|nr:DUF2293 domain-containing protein [Deltaproteobacteria bacterium]